MELFSSMRLLLAALLLLVALISLAASNALPAQQVGGPQSVAEVGAGSRPERDAGEKEKKKAGKKDGSFKKECISAHNKWRRIHSADELKMDPKLTLYAQSRADYIAASDGDKFEHLKDSPYGENLAWHTDLSSSCTKLAGLWYEELKLYNFSRPVFDLSTGHFTQMVWRETTRVGCARQVSSGPQGGVYLVCNYDPPGNFVGEFRENVRPAKEERPAISAAGTSTAAPTTTKGPVSATSPTTSTTTTITTTTTTTTESSLGGSTTELATALKPSVSAVDGAERPTTKPKPKGKKKKSGKRKKGDKRKKGNKNKNKKKRKPQQEQSNSTVSASTTEEPATRVTTTTV